MPLDNLESPPPRLLGWREWVTFDSWSVPFVKAKVDTGARTSSLHAFGVESFDRDGNEWVRFEVHPWQRSEQDAVMVEAPLIDRRSIKSSTADVQNRPVVSASVLIAGVAADIEITLTNRDEMGFRMLLGREAIREQFLVHPGRSYLGGRPPLAIRRKNRERV